MLKFLGFGSAFAVNNNNCSAFFIENNTLNLFDCGETVFENLVKKKILTGIKSVNIFLTHLHSDHSGSIGTLLFYLSAIGLKKEDVKVYYRDKKSICKLLKIFDVINECIVLSKKKDFEKINIVPYIQQHNRLNSYGYMITRSNKNYYYTGDMNIPNNKVINMFLNNEIDKLYIDTDINETSTGKYHFPITKLKEIIPINIRNKVVCMHLSDSADLNKIKKEGFLLPEVI